MRVRTYDTAYPDNSAITTIAITVNRNEYAPVFFPDPIRVTIEETREIGSIITIVNATDRNARVGLVQIQREQENMPSAFIQDKQDLE